MIPNHHLNKKTLSTLTQLHKHDITLTFTTKHHTLKIQHILETLSLNTYLITDNKTHIHSLKNKLLHRNNLPTNIAKLILYQQ